MATRTVKFTVVRYKGVMLFRIGRVYTDLLLPHPFGERSKLTATLEGKVVLEASSREVGTHAPSLYWIHSGNPTPFGEVTADELPEGATVQITCEPSGDYPSTQWESFEDYVLRRLADQAVLATMTQEERMQDLARILESQPLLLDERASHWLAQEHTSDELIWRLKRKH